MPTVEIFSLDVLEDLEDTLGDQKKTTRNLENWPEGTNFE